MHIKYHIRFSIEKRKDKITGKVIEENVPINCIITYNGNRIYYFIGFRIDGNNWIEENEKVSRNCFNKKGDSASDINRRIEKVRSTVNDIFDYYKGINTAPTPTEVRSEIKDRLNENKSKQFGLFEKYQEYVDNADVSDLRRKQLKVTQKHFEEFSDSIHRRITFESVNVGLIIQFENYLKNHKIPKSRNTIHSNMKRLSTFFNYSIKLKWTDFTPFEGYEFPGELYGKPIFLTKEELKQLTQFELEDKEDDLVRDLFVLQCHVGARVGDYISFTKDNVIENTIKYIPNKTKDKNAKPLEVPLSKTAKRIIKKYGYPNGKLMPFIHPNYYNEKLKPLFRKVKLTRKVLKYDSLTETEKIVDLASEVGTHTARRTFIGILHKTQKNEFIASMSGHVANSKAFERYYDVDIEDKKNALKNGGLE